jgi:methyl-accepting chemotaxis protein
MYHAHSEARFFKLKYRINLKIECMKRLNLKDLSISQQITFTATAIFLVLVIIILGFAGNQVVQSKNKVTETVTRNRSFGAMEKIDRNFYERFGDVQAYAYNRVALQMIDSGRATTDGQNFINTMMAYYVLYDLMMVVDRNGKVVAVNTLDRNGVPLKTDFLLGTNFSTEEWYRVCLSAKGPEGGAWYSDFMSDPVVAKIFNSKGYGMAFAAPIKDDGGNVIGVWYNFAGWKEVTQGIREETELLLKAESPEAFVMITDKNGTVIDASDEKLISNMKVVEESFASGHPFIFDGRTISNEDYIVGAATGKGAYTYKGKEWIALTFKPKMKFTLAILFDELLYFTLIILTILGLAILAFLILSGRISKNILRLQNIINTLSQGELTEIEENKSKDEIGKMTNSISSLIGGLKKTSGFANEIGNGNLTADFEPLSDKDVLGHSLVVMRNNLAKVAEEDKQRNWSSLGLAKFAEVLRNQDDLHKLGDMIIYQLVEYMNANQGGIFIINDDDQDNVYLELLSCYAWDKKKFMSKHIAPGEGLVGECWQEGRTIYLTEIPENYVAITSGLGKANPRNILIVPLKINEEIFGVIELASFRIYKDYEREFIERACENIAATISTAKVTDRTKRLLAQTQQQTEEMRAQEEEMRQNMEELSATQEEMQRKEREYLKKIAELEKKN